jgi:AraC-like DNA-binding protein
VLNQRIERSKKLLRQPNAYITDIAYRCGFADPKYFSKCFKKLTGQTPSEFQKNT